MIPLPSIDIAMIDPFFRAVQSPLVLLSESGELVLANAAGNQQFQKRFLFLRDLQALFTPFQDFLCAWRNWLVSDYPVYLSGFDTQLSLTPVYLMAQGKSRRLILLEWRSLGHDQELEMLHAVGEAVNSSLILEDIFESLGEVLHHYIPYQLASIVILDDTQNGIKTQVRLLEAGGLEIIGENNTFAGYDPVVDLMVKKPFPLLFATPDRIPDNLKRSLFLTADTASVIIVPLINKGVVIGLIAMISNQAGIFGEYHHHMLLQVSEQLAIAVENAKFYWQTQIQASREFLINQLTKAIRKSMQIEVILRTAAEELGKVTGVSRCFIHYFPKNLFLETSGSSSERSQEMAEIRVFQYAMPGLEFMPQCPEENTASFNFERLVFENRLRSVGMEPVADQVDFQKEQIYNPFILNDVADCPESISTQDYFHQQSIKSLAIFPILIRDTLVGTITLHQCDSCRVWIHEDIELFEIIAEHLGLALHQAHLFLEAELRKSELESTLTELQQAQFQLIQTEKMAVLGQFVAGIAHEVNTPLGTIASNNDILKRCLEKLKGLRDPIQDSTGESPSTLLATMEDLLQLNRLAISRIQEIVKNLRNFARLDESEMKRVDIHEGLESTLLLIKHSIPASVEIIRDYSPDFPLLTCFPGLLNQVFMNLLVNAIHATENVPSGAITIRTSVQDNQACIAILDTGKGIAPEHLPRIFDPGFTTKGVGVGTGLGLALCFKIIEKHRGKILVESKPGQGTCFQVILPL